MLRQKHESLWSKDEVPLGKGPTAQEILAWCDEHGIEPGSGCHLNRRDLVSRAGIALIDEALLSRSFASIFADFSQDDRPSASLKGPYEKHAKIKPTHHLLLVALTEQQLIQPLCNEYYPAMQFNLELDINQLHLDNFNALVVVENRDSFNDWFKYHIPAELKHALVVYRGDRHHSVACNALRKLWREHFATKPRVYFGDLDLAGIRIALSGHYSALLLPDMNFLSTNLIKQHYTYGQERYLSGLQATCPPEWQTLLDLIHEKRAALRQQWMYDAALGLYPGFIP